MPSFEPVVIDDTLKYSRNSNLKVVIEQREILGHEAKLAAEFIEKWGMVACAPDGEDAAGRQKLRPLEPAEVVERACSTAEAAFAEFRARGWVIEIPSESALNEAASSVTTVTK